MNYRFCLEAVIRYPKEKDVYGVATQAAVKVDQDGECLTGEEAEKAFFPLDDLASYGYVGRNICRALIASGRCPIDTGDLVIEREKPK